MNDFAEALKEWGVRETTLSPAEKDALDQDGYLVLPDLMDSKWLAQLRTAFEAAMDRGEQTKDARQTGTRHAADLLGKDTAFDGIYTSPKVLASVHHVLKRPFNVFQLAGRDPLPGYGQQGLHQDWYVRAPSQPFSLMTTIWLLDDFTSTNGATRLIPGSHRFPRPLPKSMQDPANRHPDQKVIIAKAGSVLLFNGHVYHSGTRNQSHQPRRVLQCQFLARELVRPDAGPPPAVAERLSPPPRYLLGRAN